jgi:hypothetical protein
LDMDQESESTPFYARKRVSPDRLMWETT